MGTQGRKDNWPLHGEWEWQRVGGTIAVAVPLKYEGQNWPGLAYFQPATEIDQLQLTFFVLKIEPGYIFLWNMIRTHT